MSETNTAWTDLHCSTKFQRMETTGGTRYIDTHCHIYDEAFGNDTGDVVKRSLESGVTGIIMPGIDSTCYSAMMDFRNSHPEYARTATGLHPTSVNRDWKNEIGFVEKSLKDGHCAIGEIGMDAYWSDEFLEEQKEAFRIQTELAIASDLPVIIHARNATNMILDILKDMKNSALRGVFHAYSGSIETCREILRTGDFRFGIGGVVTFRNASVASTVAELDLDRIVLETDAPYLTPAPHRGKRNESSYIPIIAEKIAELKSCTVGHVAETTTANAASLFGTGC